MPLITLTPGRVFEDLSRVPLKESGLGEIFPGLRKNQAGALVRQEAGGRFIVAVEMLAEHDLVGVRQYGEYAQVEHLVMQ
jgi:hypothetical protein